MLRPHAKKQQRSIGNWVNNSDEAEDGGDQQVSGVYCEAIFVLFAKAISVEHETTTVLGTTAKQKDDPMQSGPGFQCNVVELPQERRRCQKGQAYGNIPELGSDRPWSLVFSGLGIQRPIWQLRVKRRRVWQHKMRHTIQAYKPTKHGKSWDA